MRAEDVGDFAQHQGTHGDFAVFEELALAVDDGLGDALDGFEALLDVLDQPARLLQLAGRLPLPRRCLAEDFGVEAVDPQARVGVRIDVGRPLAP